MTFTAIMSLDDLTPAWRALQTKAPVKLQAIGSARHYRAMIDFMHELLEETGDRENHPLQGLVDIVTLLIEDYEKEHVQLPEADPADVLRFLMQQHGLRQADLADIFGSQSNVSEILSGKRKINARQAKALARRFETSPAVFI